MSHSSDLLVRSAVAADIPAIARLAAALVRMHHDQNAKRFLLVADVEQGYAWWFAREMERKEAVILAALDRDEIVGYAYGALEDRDWNLLLDAHGAIHDVFVSKAARHRGTGRRLVTAMVEALEARGAERIVLSTMVQNEPAKRLFASCGFHPTMIEMMR